VPLTIIVLMALYSVQRTARPASAASSARHGGLVCRAGGMGVVNIIEAPAILAAVNPLHALASGKWPSPSSLGAVVLALTGAEALYADMGHFGKKPIRVAWFLIVFPRWR
jgi:KUP system potassium uptake protein